MENMIKTIKNLKTINYALRNAYEKEKEISNKERDEKLKERDEKLKERDEKLMWKAKYEELLKKFESAKGENENMGGEEDIAYKNCIATRAAFDRAGVKHEYSQMPGGHTWYVWRYNLRDLAPLCFR